VEFGQIVGQNKISFQLLFHSLQTIQKRDGTIFTNVAVNHRGGLVQPHVLWGVPKWPYHPKDNENTTVVPYSGPLHYKRGCIIYYAVPDDLHVLRRSLVNLEYHFTRIYQYPVFIFHTGFSERDFKFVKSAVSDQFTEIQFVQVSSSRNTFYLKDMFEQDVLREYGFFLRFDPATNILADLQWDPFQIAELYQFNFGFHRWHSPMGQLEPAENPELWKIAADWAGKKGITTELPPLNFYYSLQYFALGNFDFFRSSNYLDFVSKIPDSTSASTSHVWPLALSLLDPSPWRKVFDMTNINVNWYTSDVTPFAAPSWLEQTPVPTWPFRYKNHNPPCPPE